jgi:hypothetical protein
LPEHSGHHFSGAKALLVSIFLVPEHFQCQHFSGARALPVPALLCQHFLVPELFWCQPFSGASPFPVPEHFWCQHFWCQSTSGVSPFLVRASTFLVQHCSGISIAPASALGFASLTSKVLVSAKPRHTCSPVTLPLLSPFLSCSLFPSASSPVTLLFP